MNSADLFLWILNNLNYWVVALFMAIEFVHSIPV